MNGPEHYHAAEQLLNAVHGREKFASVEAVNGVIAAAQAHATLALAAATVQGRLGVDARREWSEAVE